MSPFSLRNAPSTVALLVQHELVEEHPDRRAVVVTTAFVGRSPGLVELDARTGLLYVTNHGPADVSVLNTALCNAKAAAGCTAPVPEVNVGSHPNGLAVDELTGTVYVLSLGSGTMSLLGS
jgi:DNA-binding beta-propeller fold protein YncE